MLHRKRRRGNLLLIVLMSAFIAALLSSAVLAAAHSIDRAKRQAASITAVYDGLAMADIFARAFVSDFDLQYYQEPIPIGTMEIGYEFYETLIENTQGFVSNMNMTLLPDGRYVYNGDAELVINDVVSRDVHSGGIYHPNNVGLGERAWNVAHSIDTFQIYLSQKPGADPSNGDNLLLGATGDKYYFADIVFDLQFSDGISFIQQRYRLSNVYAKFTHSGGAVKCDIETDEAVLLLEAQSIG